MRSLIDYVAWLWRHWRALRLIAMLEREQTYHRQLLYFHAGRAHAVHHTLLRVRREFALFCQRGHRPSAGQLDGSRR